MIALFDISELNNLYETFYPLSLHVDLSTIVKIMAMKDELGDAIQKQVIWEVIESSEHFDDEYFMTTVDDNYLIKLDNRMDDFNLELFQYLSGKLNAEIMIDRISSVDSNGVSLILEIEQNV